MARQTLARRLVAAREAAGLSQKDAAAAARISQPYLHDLEHGIKDPERAALAAARRWGSLRGRLSRALGQEIA